MSGRLLLILCVVLAVGLCASSVLSVALFLQGNDYYRQLNETRLDPLGLNSFPSEGKQTPASTLSTKTVVFFGDSRAASWPEPTGVTSYRFINRGIGAQTSAQALGRFDHDIAGLAANIIIVQVGINDLKTIPLFPERRPDIVAACKTNIKAIIDKSISDGMLVILTTIFPVGPVPLERRFFWSPAVDETIYEVNISLKSLVGPKVIVMDAASILTENGGTRSKYIRDTIHINSAGYDALNAELRNILLERIQ